MSDSWSPVDYSKPSGNIPNSYGYFADVALGGADGINLTIGDFGNRIDFGSLYNEDFEQSFDDYLSRFSTNAGTHNVTFSGGYNFGDAFIGRHQFEISGRVTVSSQGQISFNGYLKSLTGEDTYNFNLNSNRRWYEQLQTTVGYLLTRPNAWLGIPPPVNRIIGRMPVSYNTTFSDPNAVGPRCFNEYALISTIEGPRYIFELQVGDTILAFDPSANRGRGALVPRRVTRLFRNTTTEWIRLSWMQDGEAQELVTTPGHHFLDRFGGFPPIEKMIAQGRATVVLASGELTEVTAERIVFSAETAHMFERARVSAATDGSSALAEVELDAWQTYNFEVEEHHTYIAGGVRVHNISDPVAHNGVGIDDFTPYGISFAVAYDVPGYGNVAIRADSLNSHYDAMGGSQGFAGTATGWGLSGAFAAQDTYQNAQLSAGVFGVAYDEKIGKNYSPEYRNWAFFATKDYLAQAEPRSLSRQGWAESLGPNDYGYATGSPMHIASESWSDGGGFLGAYAATASVSRYSDEAYNAYHEHVANMLDRNAYARNNSDSRFGREARERAAQREAAASISGRSRPSSTPGIEQASDHSPGTGSNSSSGKNPVLFDLNGDGFAITELDESTHYFNLGGDGYDHRTAWAGVGDGVLVFDADGDGEISDRNEVVFTDWDPSAGSDMEALRQVFDTNQNGLLDAGDAEWASFHIMVTQADGSTVMRTLAELGIQSLTLDADETRHQFDDGSSLDGETIFTRTDGTTGTAATATLMVDIEGYAVTEESSTDASGQSVIVTTVLNANGSLASQSTRTTSVDGLTVTTEFDENGDGVIDRVLTVVRENLTGGSTRTTETDRTGAGVLIGSEVTETSSDGSLVTISRDTLGGGYPTQTETRVTGADGSLTTTVSNLAADGSTVSINETTFSSDRSLRTERLDRDGNGTYERVLVSQTIQNADGSQTQIERLEGGHGTLLSQTVVNIAADGLSRTENVDLDGDGNIDRRTTSSNYGDSNRNCGLAGQCVASRQRGRVQRRADGGVLACVRNCGYGHRNSRNSARTA